MSHLAHTLAEPWGQEVVRRAFLEAILLGIAGGALGCWVVLHELSYSAESLAHGMFPGLVAAALLGVPLLIGGAVGIAVAALAVAVVGRLPGLDRDVGVAVVVTTLFGLGALLALSPDSPPGVQSLLFGDILGVSDGDLWLAGGLALVVGVSGWFLNPRLLATGFDRAAAASGGMRVGLIDGALMLLLAVAVLVAIQGLGSLLVVALLVAPAATARMVTRRADAMVAVAVGVAVAGGCGGLYLSYYASTAAGASIAAVLVGACLVTALFARVPGRRARSRTAPGA
jgi:ABC-type Mn2+/Zn2+ transport system permease subunit